MDCAISTALGSFPSAKRTAPTSKNDANLADIIAAL
jgi:hypothetical protein